MPFCTRCRPPSPNAVVVLTATGGDGYRAAAACARHEEAVRAWVASVGTVHEERVQRAPPPEPAPQIDDQQALF